MANTSSNDQGLLIDQDRGKPWKIFFDNIEDLSIASFWYHNKWPQEGLFGYAVFTIPN